MEGWFLIFIMLFGNLGWCVLCCFMKMVLLFVFFGIIIRKWVVIGFVLYFWNFFLVLAVIIIGWKLVVVYL